jgi:ribonuclease HI
MAEAYALYQGVLLVQEHQLNQITIVGDSKNIIRHFVLGTIPKNTKLQRIVDRIKLLLSPIHVNFIHVLRGNNEAADNMANQAIGLAPGHMKSQGWVHFAAPP